MKVQLAILMHWSHLKTISQNKAELLASNAPEEEDTEKIKMPPGMED